MDQITSKKLHTGIKVLANNVVDAVVHWKLVNGLHEAAKTWPLVIQQSNTFWALTIKAHTQMSLYAMCRVFDQESKSLHLSKLLKLIEDNLCLFDESEFRTRLSKNPFVELLAESAQRPDSVQLSKDIAVCSKNDSLVHRLIQHRNNYVGHLGEKLHLDNTSLPPSAAITNQDYELLLKRATEIVNRYSSLFSAETYSTQIFGHKDYETVFRWVQDRVELSTKPY